MILVRSLRNFGEWQHTNLIEGEVGRALNIYIAPLSLACLMASSQAHLRMRKFSSSISQLSVQNQLRNIWFCEPISLSFSLNVKILTLALEFIWKGIFGARADLV